MQVATSLSKLFRDNISKRSFCVEAYYLTLWRKIQNYDDIYLKIENLDIITLFSISWRFDSISNIEIENWVESSWINSKIIGIESSFKSIPNVKIVELNRFQKLESKLDLTINLIKTISRDLVITFKKFWSKTLVNSWLNCNCLCFFFWRCYFC